MSGTYKPHPGARQAELSTVDYANTLEQIGLELGITKERVRQLESRALAKAYKILTERGYTMADFLEGLRDGQRRRTAATQAGPMQAPPPLAAYADEIPF